MKKRLLAALLCTILFSIYPVQFAMASGSCDSHNWGYKSYTQSEQVFDGYTYVLDQVYNTKGEIITVGKYVAVYKTVYYIVHEMYCTKCGYIGDSGRNQIGY